MAYQFITYEKRDNIAWVAINRPEVMNALHLPADEELFQVWQDFDADPQLRVAILSGAGERAFCAGSDLKYEAELTGRGEQASHLAFGGFGALTDPRSRVRKPIIAAVHGYALGGGFELALACDLIIAAEQAQFGLPEPRVGVVAGAGGMHRLPRQLPLKTAMGMLLTGKYLSAQDAYRLGLVNEVAPLPDLLSTAERWAREIIQCAPLSIVGSKQAAMAGLDLPLEAAISNNYSWVEASRSSPDRSEGILAFVEKRPPQWRGVV